MPFFFGTFFFSLLQLGWALGEGGGVGGVTGP